MKSGKRFYYIKKMRPKGLKRGIREIVEDDLLDIAPYIVNDIMKLLQKKGIVYAAKKTTQKNKKKTKKKK